MPFGKQPKPAARAACDGEKPAFSWDAMARTEPERIVSDLERSFEAELRDYGFVPELWQAVRGDPAWQDMVRERAWWRQTAVCERVGHCAAVPVAFLPMAGDVRVCVHAPDKSNVNAMEMTSQVLLEVGDWFETETAFVRGCIEPTWLAIDIGANHGVFALHMAKKAEAGRVWAFEPVPETADLLETSKHANRLDNLCVVREAVSDEVGSAEFVITAQGSEFNHLVFDASHQAAPDKLLQERRQTVMVTTLDDLTARFG
jgi:FkbM family methyltransferase